MQFPSVLFNGQLHNEEREQIPDYFTDLNLDQVIDAILAGKQEYNLRAFFYTPLRDIETIYYRHAIMKDMAQGALMAKIKKFADHMNIVRRYLGLVDRLEFDYHKKGWFLEAALVYCDGVSCLAEDIGNEHLHSAGLKAYRRYLVDYVNSREFQSLRMEANRVKNILSEIKYCLIIQTGKFSVRKYEDETDYSVEVIRTFEKFKQGAVNDYRSRLTQSAGMNHIEAKILEFVSRLYPEQFAALDRFYDNHKEFMDDAIRVFDREIQFYVAYLEFIADIQRNGLGFCYPQISDTAGDIYAQDAYDIALAYSLRNSDTSVVCNDFSLRGTERVIVVTGPNQGGKTTFARMFGQLHYLASLGCPVPARDARLFLFDQIYTHFEKKEDIHNQRGKLQDDLVRIYEILNHATANSILIVNEIFSSTTLVDAIFLSKEIMAKVMELNLYGVWVTFISELSSLSEKTVSMVSTGNAENMGSRPFKILRQPADGLAFALSLAKKHRLLYDQIIERISL